MHHGAYGVELARRFNKDDAPFLKTTTLRSAQLAATRVTTGSKGSGLTDYIPIEKAYIVTVRLQPIAKFESWRAGKLMFNGSCPAGSISIMNLQDEPKLNLPTFYDCVKFYIPEVIFRELGEREDMPLITDLRYSVSAPDPVMFGFANVLAPLFNKPVEDRSLFFDHLSFAAYLHLAKTYGGAEQPPVPIGTLSEWQLRRATEMLAASVEEGCDLLALASACDLPLERFLRAFRKSTGMPPHRWLRDYKVKRATELLQMGNLPISEIAYACGFSDQSHMTRVFVSMKGCTPGAVRRAAGLSAEFDS
ncbi:helix-turn-helix domain-containing protein [Rhizobium mesosinicum]|uniref:Helix-turn-helix transcriptional regulator n=1 Tax=Rhizobium mesosinicum TaxID=335017 RepID=A0ABS7GM48_9HYPH|nr:AraC family transcriptional regulator [Rhizobium mesosinicum]MBW9051060.1 helix-turn-helix transcriptional regulator [Rhizobium mesosinicum]